MRWWRNPPQSQSACGGVEPCLECHKSSRHQPRHLREIPPWRMRGHDSSRSPSSPKHTRRRSPLRCRLHPKHRPARLSQYLHHQNSSPRRPSSWRHPSQWSCYLRPSPLHRPNQGCRPIRQRRQKSSCLRRSPWGCPYRRHRRHWRSPRRRPQRSLRRASKIACDSKSFSCSSAARENYARGDRSSVRSLVITSVPRRCSCHNESSPHFAESKNVPSTYRDERELASLLKRD